MITSFGPHRLSKFTVATEEVNTPLRPWSHSLKANA